MNPIIKTIQHITHICSIPRIRMMIIGTASFAGSYLSFLAFFHFSMHFQIASFFAFIVYWAISFLGNKYWSFQNRTNTRKQALMHAAMHINNQLIIMLGLQLLVTEFNTDASIAQLLMQTIAATIAFILTPIIFRRHQTSRVALQSSTTQ